MVRTLLKMRGRGDYSETYGYAEGLGVKTVGFRSNAPAGPLCQLVFVDQHAILTPQAEKNEYDKHQNAITDVGYRRFLGRLQKPLLERLPPDAAGLDFGCGPGPALAAMFEEAGHAMALYDIYYYPDESVLRQHYDFITMTEVVEHLRDPMKVLDAVWAKVKPGGHLGIMTKLVRDKQAFMGWHYKNDPTHIIFFSSATLRYIASRWHADFEQLGADAFVFTK